MRLIGLCGRSGCGKSLFCTIAERLGIKIIDCDKVYKNLVSYRSPCLTEIENAFGSEVIENNSLNRRVLAPIVFSNPEKLSLLNEITNKHILNEVNIIIENSDDEIIILDAPTLFESGLDEKCDLIIGIIASDEICISRIIKRDGITKEEAALRLSNQKNLEFLVENCDILIYNDSSIKDYEVSSIDVIKSLLEGRI